MKRWLDLLIPFALLLAALVLRVEEGPGIERLRNLVFDSYQRFHPRPYADAGVTIVDIDEESLAQIGQWPWPRSKLAELVTKLGQQGANAVALDIILAEPDRTGPQNLIRLWSDSPDLAALRGMMLNLPDPDQALAEALAAGPTVVAFALVNEPVPSSGLLPMPHMPGVTRAGDDAIRFVPRFSEAVRALPIFEEAAHGYGAVNTVPDSDGTIRRLPLLFAYGDNIVPGFTAETLRVFLDSTTYQAKASHANNVFEFTQNGVSLIRIAGKNGKVIVPTEENGSILLYDTGTQPNRFVPAWRVFDGSADTSRIAGHIILVGSTTEGLKDLRSSPLSSTMSGVEVNAQILEQLLTGTYLKRPFWASEVEIVFLLLFGSALIIIARRFTAIGGAVVGFLGSAAAIGASWFAFTRYGWLVDPIFPVAVATVLYMTTTFLGYLKTEGEKRFIRDVFSQMMSPILVEKLASQPEPPKLGGELRDLTVMFSDLQGFTSIAEGLAPQDLTRLINRFMTPMARVIQDDHAGTIDKFMGDAIMAFWNAPLDVPDHPRRAVEAALGMREALLAINAELAREAAEKGEGPMGLAFGIGINTGPCSVGYMGSEQRKAYTTIGDAVNLASRLEGLTRLYGVDCVLGDSTAQAVQPAAGAVPAFALLEVDLVRVKGKQRPEPVHALIGDGSQAASGLFQTLAALHRTMIQAYRAQNWDGAAAALAQLHHETERHFPRLMPLYALYDRRVAGYRLAPPAQPWDGVYDALGKTG
ncbi:CHASE2 domain-containing protein [Hypericibacter sp.]|uniref:CHASE2 domain-containing protein n=1 Tax=Hypericibacter sp. TaxID=2705401 RepID=UPI003D6C7A95